jgi:carotenoid cleavage dioxygenase-like enzyme
MAATTNQYLEGNFAPVHEEATLPCPEVEGAIPEDLDGFFLRVGPNNQFDPPSIELYHPFDGDGMIHEVELKGGQATYRNRWIRTRGFEREREAGKALWGGFASMGVVEPPADMPMKNLANTAMAFHSGRLLATWEGGLPTEVTLPDLDTIGECNFDGGWEYAITAHPKVDPRTGELIVFCYSPVVKPYVQYGVVDAKGKVTHQAGIDLQGKPVMIHDMAITENYSLIFDMPVTYSMERAMSGQSPFDWEPDNGTRVGILPRHGDANSIRWFDVETGYIFHAFNAWEEGDEIVLDACRSKHTTILGESDLDHDDENARLHRYRFNLTSGTVEEGRVDETPMEFSRINEGYIGVKTRYGYASCFHPDRGLLFNGFVKNDREAGRTDLVELSDTQFNHENVFAPRVGAQAEDDGYVVGFVHDEATDQSECWVIDAQRFTDGPVAKIRIPKRVPYGFHSHWVSGEDARRR